MISMEPMCQGCGTKVTDEGWIWQLLLDGAVARVYCLSCASIMKVLLNNYLASQKA